MAKENKDTVGVLKKEKTLSDKRKDIIGNKKHFIYLEKDVKEFIRKETKLIQLWMRAKITAKEFWERRRKLAGPKLTK